MTFPLPLAPFEEYMLVDDRPAHPMSFFLRLRFDGLLQHDRLNDAFHSGVSRHPLLASNVRRPSANRFEWVPEDFQSLQVVWRTTENVEVGAIDLEREYGVRIIGAEDQGQTELLLQFHHSCCDAMGACQFIHDLLVAYHRGDRPPAAIPVEQVAFELLLRRAKFGIKRVKLKGLAHKLAVGSARARKFLMRRAVPIKPVEKHSAEESLPKNFPTSCTHRFDEPQTEGLVNGARRSGATVNSVLVRDLFLSVGTFRRQRNLGRDKDWLRLVVPVNMRKAGDEQLPAANVVSMVFLDRHPRDCDDRGTLLKSIHDEMTEIKQGRLGLTFLLSLRLRRSLPGAIRRLRKQTAKAVCQGTCVISNLVSPWKDSALCNSDGKLVIDGIILQGVEFLPPVRPYTSAAIGAVTYAGRLSLALHFDSRVLDAQEADGILSTYVDYLNQSMAAA
ncbi:MAG: hypothetical protein WBF93_15215 [Pirellulales bacterium]